MENGIHARSFKEKISDLKKRLDDILTSLDIPLKVARKEEIEKMMEDSHFWEDKRKTEKLTSELSGLKDDLETAGKVRKEIEDLETMVELEMSDDLEAKTAETERLIKSLEVKTFLSGSYDGGDCLLSVHSGQGGTEAMDWAQILERMFTRYIEKKGWEVDIIDTSPGEEAGIKSVTMQVFGRFSYGLLKGEAGVHRLVRQSPFNADRLRQTSFALVEVLPMIEEGEGLELNERDLEWQFFRASTKGGQNVQKVSTAVRLKHKPTGIIVTSQSERYQEKNREIARSLLKAKLWVLQEEEKKKEKQRLKGEYKTPGWGNQIRSYVLHPYKMVKDLRTQVERSDPENILGGDLDDFIEAELKKGV